MSTILLPPVPFAAPPGPDAGPAHLLRLVRRIAVEDHAAFADLYHALSDRLLRELRSTLSDPTDAAAITCATFVEVWMLARGHVTPDTDVYAWIRNIVGRRSADRQPVRADTECGDGRGLALRTWYGAASDRHDRFMDLTLCGLLARPAQRPCRTPLPAH